MSTRKEKADAAKAARIKPLEKVEAVTDLKVTDDKPKSIISTAPPTISDMLAPMRLSAVQEKTDAAKMQKYYALTDALNAIGKMGSAAVGGAIGGNALVGAPVVPEYQPSRGYIDAFEKAKQANDRLKDIDNTAFSLSVNRYEKDKENADKAKLAAAEREWELMMFNYKTQIEQAIADKNWARKAELETALAADRRAHDIRMQNLRNQGDLAVAAARGKKSDDFTPIRFRNGAVGEIPNNYMKALKRDIIGETINGVYVDEDNVDEVIKDNPRWVSSYLRGFGINDAISGLKTYDTFVPQKDENGEWVFPAHISYRPEEYNGKSGESKEYSIENDPFAHLLAK